MVNTGFVIGTASDDVAVDQVEVALDAGSYEASVSSPSQGDIVSWNYQLPTGTDTWKEGSQHTLKVRSRDSSGNYSTVTDLTVRAGNNRDVNGDGYADLAVGAYFYNSSTGRAYVYYGGSSGIEAISSRTLTGENSGDNFGRSFAY